MENTNRFHSIFFIILFLILEWGLWIFRKQIFSWFGVTSDSSDQLIYYFGVGFDIVIRVLIPLLIFRLWGGRAKDWGITFKGVGFEKWIVLIVCIALFAFMSLAGTIDVVKNGHILALAGWSALYFISSIDQEIRYRGILQTELGTFIPYKLNLVISSLLFTFSPLHLGSSSIVFFAITFVLGIYAGYLRKRSGSLVGPILVHFFGGFAFNVLAMIVL